MNLKADTQKTQNQTQQLPFDVSSIVEKIVRDFEGKEQAGGYYMIRCPCDSHEDRNPSCKLTVTNEQKILCHCHSCGESKAYSALVEKGYIQYRKKSFVEDVWNAALKAGYFADEYLNDGRKLDIPKDEFPNSIRETDELICDKVSGLTGLLFAITDEEEKLINIQRVFLNPEKPSEKAKMDRPKRLLTSADVGGHITIFNGTNETLHIAEGPETSLAVWRFLPSEAEADTVWSAIKAENFGKMKIPERLKIIHLYADLDKNGVGEKNAKKLALRLLNEGREVYFHIPIAEAGKEENIDFDDQRESIEHCYKNDPPYDPFVQKESFEFRNAPIPEGYDVRENGVYRLLKKKEGEKEYTIEKMIFRFPVVVKRVFENLEDRSTKIEIEFFNHVSNGYERRIFEKGAITTTKSIIEEIVNKTGINNDAENIKFASNYFLSSLALHRRSMYIAKRLGWNETPESGLEFVPYSDKIQLDVSSNEGEYEISKAVHCSGNAQTYIDKILTPISRCHGASVAFAFSLATPLLKIFNIHPFTVNVQGSTGTGKSITSRVVLSMYGNPCDLTIKASSSNVGIRGVLDFYQDIPVLIDEIQLSKDDTVRNLIYETGNPGSTFKGKQHGGIHSPATARTVLFITGEIDTAARLQYDGAANRLVVIDTPPLDALNEDQAEEIKRLLDDNYGHLGKMYISKIKELLDNHKGYLRSLFQDAEDELPRNGSDIQKRQRERYAAAIVGCYILDQTIGSGHLGIAIKTELVKHWLSLSECREASSVAHRALEKVLSFEASCEGCFEHGLHGITYGAYLPDGSLAILPDRLKEIFGDDFEISNVEKQWKAMGWLRLTKTAAEVRNSCRDRAKIKGKYVLCVILNAKALEEIQKS